MLMECVEVHLFLRFPKNALGGAMSRANPSEASGEKGRVLLPADFIRSSEARLESAGI